MKKNILCVLALFCTMPFFSQNVWYVSTDGTGNGTSWGLASNNLQQIIDNAVYGDEVWVKQGIYQRSEGLSFSVKDGVSVYGGFPASTDVPVFDDRNPSLYETILEGNQARVLNASTNAAQGISSTTIIDGFTLRNGYDTSGAGLYVHRCHATFRNLKIVDNTSTFLGAGINLSSSNATFIQVLVNNNTSVSIFNGFGYTDGNTAGVRINGGETKFYNCVIADNHAEGYVGGIWINDAECYFYNSIVYGNTADNLHTSTHSNYNFRSTSYSAFYASNCILQDSGGSEYSYSTSQFIIYGTDLGGNFDADPLFNLDYSLQPNSVGINKGNTIAYLSAVNNTDKDFFNDNRIVDAIDIGLSEYQTPQPEILYVRQNGTGDGSSWANASGDLQLMMDKQIEGRSIWVAEGSYYATPYFRLREGVKMYGGFPATGNPVFEDRNPQDNETILTSVTNYIIHNYYTPLNKLTSETLLDGFIITKNQNSIEGMFGIYEGYSEVTYSDIIFRELNYSAYFGINNTNSHFINCQFLNNHSLPMTNDDTGDFDGIRKTFRLHTNAKATLTDCVFKDNFSNGGSIRLTNNSFIEINNGIIKNNNNNTSSSSTKAIGIDNSSAKITNTVFENNGFDGAGGAVVVIWGHPNPYIEHWTHPVTVTIDRCIFKNNKNNAMDVVGKKGDTISVSNTLFYKNIGYGHGAGISTVYDGILYVTNCTFTENVKSTLGNYVSGGIYISNGQGEVHIRNSILYGNIAYPYYNQNFYWNNTGLGSFGTQEVTIKNSIIGDSGGSSNWDADKFGVDLGGNLDIDPLFIDPENENYRLNIGSPAINMGDNSFFNATSTPDLSLFQKDLDGNNRIVDNVIDIGAYEFDETLMSADDFNVINTIKIYPNPTSDYIYINIENSDIDSVKVYSMQGKEVLTTNTKNVNLSDLSSGIYIVMVRSIEGKTYSVKIVKE